MNNTQRERAVRHLPEAELEQAIEDAQNSDETVSSGDSVSS
jgi:hypothetical protein